MANHSLPTLTSTYTNFLTELGARVDDTVRQNRSDTVTLTNPPVGTVRFNTTSTLWEQNTGTVGAPVWTALAATYGISITGDAGSVDGKSFGTFTAAGGIVYATSTTAAAATAAGTSGQALLSGAAGAPTWGTLGATFGGTGQTVYAVGDILFAPTTTTVGKLADVATGNALLSGGVGVAPFYGKVGLTTHVSGTLPIANGGTNSTATPTNGGAAYGTGTAVAYTAAGTAGQALVSAGAGAPVWTTLTLENLPDAAFKRSTRVGTTADLGASVFSAGVLTGFDDVVALNVTTTISTTSATTTSTAGLKVGAVISGNANIPAATTVASITNATTFVLSAAATATASAVATTFTQTIAALVVDGITLALNDRVLVKNQTSALQNGIYYLSTLGSTTIPWVLSRAVDVNVASEIGGATVNVDSGATNGGNLFTTSFKTTDTINSTAMNWYRVVDTSYTIPATQGGTGQVSYAVGDLLYANTTTTVAKLADVATGNALISGGVGVAPSYGKIGLTTHISGTLGTGNGGTNLTTFTSGGAMYATSTSVLTTGTLPLTAGGTGGNTQIAALQALGALGAQTAAKTAAYTVVAADRGDVLLCTNTWTLTLTAAATLANGFSFGVVNAGTGTITIDPNGAELVDGLATKALAPGQSCILITDGTGWRTVGLSGGGAVGGGSDDIFYENGQTVNTNYTITSGKNALSAGPITIGSGITVTIPSGSNWAIV